MQLLASLHQTGSSERWRGAHRSKQVAEEEGFFAEPCGDEDKEEGDETLEKQLDSIIVVGIECVDPVDSPISP